MPATISLVGAAHPEGLLEAASRQATSIAALNAQIDAQQRAMTQLSGGWEGTAATAAQARAESDLARQRQLVGRLEATSVALRSGGTNLAALRTQILAVSTQAASLGGMVSDDGTVRPMGANMLMTPALAGAYTTTLKTLLGQFDAVDQSTAQALNTAFGPAREQPPPPDYKWTVVTMRNPWGDGSPLIQMRLGDLVGTNPLGGLGLGPTAMINIGQM